jgi:GNAT superfamily N-acetyltransferase
MTGYRCERASSAHTAALLALFEAAGNGCYCNYWHFEGDKNAWLERCYLKPEENRAALAARLAGAELCGVVAEPAGGARRPDGSVVTLAGWMKVARSGALPRLYDQRVYRRLPCFDQTPPVRERTYTVGCVYVAEGERGRGVGKALLDAAIAAAREAGAAALEAFPRGTPAGEKLRSDEVWMGPEALYLQAGFQAVSDFRAYPVLRLSFA